MLDYVKLTDGVAHTMRNRQGIFLRKSSFMPISGPDGDSSDRFLIQIPFRSGYYYRG